MTTKPFRRLLRGPGKSAQAVLRWKRLSFNDAPSMFGNAKPKSGSHLLLQILNGFTQIMPYKYVEADPIRTIEKKGRRKSISSLFFKFAQHLSGGVHVEIPRVRQHGLLHHPINALLDLSLDFAKANRGV